MHTQLSAPALLLVHGALGSADQMTPLADACRATAQFASVTILELPGHGGTPCPDGVPFAMSTFAAAVRDAVEALAPRLVVVFGYSMGGYAALVAAAHQPGLAAGIVTLGTMVHWTPAVAEAGARRLDPEGIRSKVPAFAAALEARHRGAGGWEQTLTHTAAMLRALGDAPPLTPTTFAQIRTPVLLLVGSRDDSVTLEEAQAAAQLMGQAQAASLEDVPHPIEKVPVDVLVSHLTAFVSRRTAE